MLLTVAPWIADIQSFAAEPGIDHKLYSCLDILSGPQLIHSTRTLNKDNL